MGWEQFRALVIDVADELGARRKETWAVARWHEDHAWPAATLDGPDSARLFVQYGFDCAGKITVTGRLPEGTHAGRGIRLAANADPARGARAIAQAADTRVLRAGYLDILPGKVAQKQANDAIEAARDAAAARAAALFEVPDPQDGKLYLSRFLSRRGVADFGQRGDQVSLDLNGVPLPTALRILAVLAEDTRANCCYSYGPGHHPDLSTAGCLRERSERGHDASRERIVGLLAGHGIDTGRAVELLDTAYRDGGWGSELEGTGITAGYDFDHCEFTVSLPRPEQADTSLSSKDHSAPSQGRHDVTDPCAAASAIADATTNRSLSPSPQELEM
jgi:hypothetical protein